MRTMLIALAAVAGSSLAAGPELPGRDFTLEKPAHLIQAWLGMTLENRCGARLEVVVRSVRPHSPAAKAGVRTGDVLVFMEDQLVGTVEDVARLLLRAWRPCPIALDVERDGRPVILAVKIAEP